jgi:hypothetical protein
MRAVEEVVSYRVESAERDPPSHVNRAAPYPPPTVSGVTVNNEHHVSEVVRARPVCCLSQRHYFNIQRESGVEQGNALDLENYRSLV